MSVDTSVTIAGIEFRNPVIAASGTFGFGLDYESWEDLSQIGGISLKGMTPAPKEGNPTPRIAEVTSGVLNSVGLQNPGVVEFLRKDCEKVTALPTVIIANVAGATAEEYIAVVEALDDHPIDMYELNVSCPNVAEGGMGIGTNPGAVRQLTEAVKKITDKPVIVKLTPNVTDIVAPARAAKDGGADAVSLINTMMGMAIDARSRRPVLKAGTGGLSGPAIKPVALRMVWQVASADLGIPVIGMGGIMTGEDAAEFMIAGASAVMVGTATLRDPGATSRIARELAEFAESEGVSALRDLTGTLKAN